MACLFIVCLWFVCICFLVCFWLASAWLLVGCLVAGLYLVGFLFGCWLVAGLVAGWSMVYFLSVAGGLKVG